MRVEEIALRQEIRQILNEAGYNKNTMKDLVLGMLNEEIEKATKQAIKSKDNEGYIQDRTDRIIKNYVESIIRDEVKRQVSDKLRYMTLQVVISGVNNKDGEG